ncbi:hypothetical protein ACFWWN_36650 [Streptomyces sp. NPDC059082]|uniref:hypothetical protein n=1 Tax=Streptomyces sp. NPDC059082 TaxID=3346720 RepID=UPI003680C8EC
MGTLERSPRRGGLLAEGFATVALSCIGSPLTAAIYQQGHHRRGQGPSGGDCPQPERSAGQGSGRAVTSVNGAAVTQSSTAVPGIALYTGLLRGVLGEGLVPPIRQIAVLWDQLTGVAPLVLDGEGRVRLDAFGLTGDVQAAVAERWESATRRPSPTWPISTGSVPRPDGPTESVSRPRAPGAPWLSPSEFPARPTGFPRTGSMPSPRTYGCRKPTPGMCAGRCGPTVSWLPWSSSPRTSGSQCPRLSAGPTSVLGKDRNLFLLRHVRGKMIFTRQKG